MFMPSISTHTHTSEAVKFHGVDLPVAYFGTSRSLYQFALTPLRMPYKTSRASRSRGHPPSQAKSEAIDEQSRTHTRPGRAGSHAGARLQAKKGNVMSNTGR